MRYLFLLIVLFVGCANPCQDVVYTTSGVCVMPPDGGEQFDPDKVDMVVDLLDHHVSEKFWDVDLEREFESIGVNLTSVHEYHERLHVDNKYVGGVTVNGQAIYVHTGYQYSDKREFYIYYLLAHELLHVVVENVIHGDWELNAQHMNPYVWRTWAEHTPGSPDTVERLVWNDIALSLN